jgi:flagellar hook-associated protein 1 FlgK
MPDMLNTAVSGLLAFQRALSTTSHNISNVNTAGYSRQTVEFETTTPSFFGDNYYGNGVRVLGVNRAYDQFLISEVQDTTSVHSRLQKFSDLAAHVDDVLADPQGGVSPILHEFFASVQDVSDDPASTTARLAMIGTAQTLASRYQSIDNRFEELEQNTVTDLRDIVDDINALVVAVRDINLALNNAGAFTDRGQQSADLLDKRDHLLNQLAEKVDISVVEEADNQISIFIGNGQTMLSGVEAFSLSAQPDASDPARDVIVYNGLITVYDLSQNLNGGELGGLIDFRNNVLDPARNALGRSAIGIAETFNAQMRDGMDLNGNLGQDFFSYSPPQSIGFAGNVGTPTVTTVVSDVSAMTTNDYNLTFDGANWTLTSASGSSASVANGAPATLAFEGLTLTIDGATAVAGDQFTVKPSLSGSANLQVLITDPAEIAAASPVRSEASLGNLGNVEISGGVITDVTDVNLLNAATFTFDNPATTFRADINVIAGGVSYVAGSAIPFSNNLQIDANGWQVSLNGVPQANDVLSVQSNVGGIGDNRNALNLANLQNAGVFNGGIASYQEDYGSLVGYVGSQALAARLEGEAQESLLIQATNRLSSKVSVNLDEEAADLIRFQQAYEATARIISSYQTMFDTLLNSVR